MMGEGTPATSVAEIQGLEGSFSFAERLLQRIWLRGDFDRPRATTADGRAVRILNPGRWNSRGGPDFRDARLEIAGERLFGDIELHLRAQDWKAHGHSGDRNYDRVILHVVLFPPSQLTTEAAGGRLLPVLALLPLLYRSLEEYAEDDAVERLADHPLAKAQEALLRLDPVEQRRQLDQCAGERWSRKVEFASRRLQRFGWDEACHQTALEVLGYRFNRGPMLALAGQFPLADWPAAGTGDRLLRLEAEYAGRWNRQAVRPANHPRARLRQYAEWTLRVPHWPAKLESLAGAFTPSGPVDSGREFRRRAGMRKLWDRLSMEVCGDSVGGTRFNTLLCDGFLPLLAAAQLENEAQFRGFWVHGFPGDIPESIARILRALQLAGSPEKPLSHGLCQGFLGWSWREEERMQQTTACP